MLILIFVLKMRILRLRQVKSVAPSHTASQWSQLRTSDSKSHSFPLHQAPCQLGNFQAKISAFCRLELFLQSCFSFSHGDQYIERVFWGKKNFWDTLMVQAKRRHSTKKLRWDLPILVCLVTSLGLDQPVTWQKSTVCSDFIAVGFAREDFWTPPPWVCSVVLADLRLHLVFYLQTIYINPLGSQELS